LRRHFQREKKLHWHIDRLTIAATSINAFAIEGARECEIIIRLGRLPDFRRPLARFGSGDCPACPSHLLEYCP
jgi:Uri superfamily endonuclease